MPPSVFAPWTAGSGADPIKMPAAGNTPAPSIDWTAGTKPFPHQRATDAHPGVTPNWLAAIVGHAEDDELYQKPNAGMRFKTTNGLR
jgi:hypothetical protein